MNLNATNIMDYLVCPARFKYRSILKVKEDLVESEELLFGKEMHNVLELFPEKWDSIDVAFKRYADRFNNSEKFYNQLSIFDTHFKWILGKNDLREMPFAIRVKDADFSITGRFDRITENGIIIDWKTGDIKNDLSFNLQAIIYNFAYKNIFGREPKDIFFCSLKNGKIASYSQSKNTEILEKTIIEKIIPKIQEDKIFINAGLFNNACDFCLYRITCHREIGIYEENNKKGSNELFIN